MSRCQQLLTGYNARIGSCLSVFREEAVSGSRRAAKETVTAPVPERWRSLELAGSPVPWEGTSLGRKVSEDRNVTYSGTDRRKAGRLLPGHRQSHLARSSPFQGGRARCHLTSGAATAGICPLGGTPTLPLAGKFSGRCGLCVCIVRPPAGLFWTAIYSEVFLAVLFGSGF